MSGSPCRCRWIAALLSLAVSPIARGDSAQARCDIYPRDSDHASASIPCTFSQRQGHVSIQRADGVRHELSPGGGAGMYLDEDGRAAYRRKGLGARGLIFRLERETVYVYWDTAGLPGRAPVPSAGAAPPVPGAGVERPFTRTLTLQGVTFQVHCANEGSTGALEIRASGLDLEALPLSRPVDGTVTGAEVADLDADGSPELYVYVTSAGSGSYGSLVAYAANRRRSLSEVHLPPISAGPAAEGYRGHDQFAVVENLLVRRFPVYRDGDTNARPTGGTRQVQYRLARGEAGWLLEVDRVVGY